MILNNSNKNNFWNNHTLNDFQHITTLKNINSIGINSICFLIDGRLALSFVNNIFIYNKNTFQIEIKIKEKQVIYYMNINKEGILITCLNQIYINLYKIKGKKYQIIQTLKALNNIFKSGHSLYIQKFIELNNGDLAILAYGLGIFFYKKNKTYSYLERYYEKKNEHITDICELDNKQFIISLRGKNMIQFLDMNSKKKIIKSLEPFLFLDSKNELILMNKKDLLILEKNNISIIDIQKKVKIKNIKLDIVGSVNCIYKLSDNNLLINYWHNYIEQLKYDEIKKEIKLISKIGNSNYDNRNIYKIPSISIFNNNNNNLIVFPYNDQLGDTSLNIYKLILKK